MKRITQIDIYNYRAFFNEKDNRGKYRINLPNGENLLIYGENGSGKSSFFKALQELFLSGKNEGITTQYNIFSLTDPDSPDAEVRITISEKPPNETHWFQLPEIIFNNSAPTTYGNSILNNSTASFLTYRDILKTYFLEIENHDDNPNLFYLLINKLLANITDSSTYETLLDVLEGIEQKVSTIKKAIGDALALPDEFDPSKTQLETKGSEAIRDEIIGQINTSIEEFNIVITSTLENALINVNQYLNEFFKANIKVMIKDKDNYLTLKHEGENNFILIKDLKLDLSYYESGHGTESYQVFLNEGRLSALGICIYLSAVKLDQSSDENLRFIFLDDIFIGLDTSNRIPLLEILKKDFNEFQLFITTYDRQWYELAKSYLSNWKSIEMYVGKNDALHIEFPVIIDTNLEYIEKAKRFIDSFDYPSAGNTIRKAFEKRIEKLIPRCYLIGKNDLDDYFNQLIKYYENCNCEDLIDKKLKNDLYIFKDIILNPTSHYDLKSPIYKREVEQAYNILKTVYALPILNRVPILNIGDTLYYNNSPNNYKAQYILTETVYSITYSENNSKVTIPEHKLVYWEYKNIAFSDRDGSKYDKNTIDRLKNLCIKLADRPKRIQHFLSLPDLPNWLTEFKNSKGQSVRDLQLLNSPET
jgi:recombinational DNA repair ATPase RecF